MSDLKVGDKVKFLNTSGGGVVAKVIDSRTVSVLIEDGFEIPTMTSELVKIDSTNSSGRFFEDHYNLKVPAKKEVSEEIGSEDNQSELPAQVTGGRKKEEIYLAFVPHDQKWLITGPLDVILVNNSSFDVLYNIFHKTPIGHFEGVDYGNIFPDSTLVMKTINREQVIHWTDGYIQFLFHREQSKEIIPPFNAEFKIDGKKFFKEGNYRQHPVIRDKGVVVRILSLTDYLFRETVSDSDEAQSEYPEAGIPNPKPLIFSHQISPREAEIDLHIHELVEDPANLEKHEILDFQKNYFSRCIDSALANNFLKVTAIHGVGNGVLRSVLVEWLSHQQGLEFTEAPMAKYGVGALEIRLPHRK